MRPRPFKFFFAFSLGVILFLFFARFIIMALIGAAILSGIFFIARRIKYFFRRLRWEEEGYYDDHYRHDYRAPRQLPVWKDDLLVDYPTQHREVIPDYRSIEVK